MSEDVAQPAEAAEPKPDAEAQPAGPAGPRRPPPNDGLTPAQRQARRAAAIAAAQANAQLVMHTPVSTDSIERLRRRRLRSIGLRFGLGTLVPTLLTALYLGLVASPQYESTADFTIESSEGGGGGGMELLMGNSLSAALRDTILSREQISSQDMANHLVDRHGFARHYQEGKRDPLFRLKRGASREDVFDYYQDRVEAEFDYQTGVVHVKVRAFSREDAVRFTEAILAESERRMNERMERARRDTLTVAEREVQRAAERLEQARAAVAAVRAEGGELDPTRTAEANVGVRTQVEMQLAAAQAELVALLQTMQPEAPQVMAARQRVNGLIASISRENRRMVSAGQNDLQARLEVYEPAVLNKEMAQQAYTAAVESLEGARRQLIQQHRYLVRVAGPTMPGESTYPDVFFGSLTVFLASLGLVVIASLLLASVREHANV